MEVDAKVVRQGAYAVLIFFFTHTDFPDQHINTAKIYIYVTEEDEEDRLFVLAETVVSAVRSGVIGTMAVGENNHTDCAEANNALNLLLGRTSNIRSEDIAEFYVKGSLSVVITIQNQRMSLDRVILLLSPVIGGERVLFDPGSRQP